jgi:dienelactone hydrolase
MHSYPKVLHAFCDPDANQPELGILYDADAATRAWASMKAFLAEVLA